MQKRKHSAVWHRLFCLLMAFYVINVSIDAPDGYVSANRYGEYQEDLSVNEIESLGELILESVFGIHDAVPEHDESNEEEDQLTKIFMDWSIPSPLVHLFSQSCGRLSYPHTGALYWTHLPV